MVCRQLCVFAFLHPLFDLLVLFLDDQYKQYLTPAFALSGTIPTSTLLYENMSPSEMEAFINEMEPDIRAADRDLREIDILEKKDVTSAGSLPEYQKLQPRLDQLLQANEENRNKHAELEQRIARIMNQYASTVRLVQHVGRQSTNSFRRRIHFPNCLLLGTTHCTMQKVRWRSFIVTVKSGKSWDWHEKSVLLQLVDVSDIVLWTVFNHLCIILIARECG